MTAVVKTVLLGAGGFTREVLAIVRDLSTHVVFGILDDDHERLGGLFDGVPVTGPIDSALSYVDVEFLVCAESGAERERIVGRLEELGIGEGAYTSVIAPTVALAPGTTIGEGSVMLAQAVVTAAQDIGRHVVVMPHATVSHGDVLEDFVTVGSGASLGGGVRVGRGARIGMNATVHGGVNVGEHAVLEMGAVLHDDLPAHETWSGVPARPAHTSVPVGGDAS